MKIITVAFTIFCIVYSSSIKAASDIDIKKFKESFRLGSVALKNENYNEAFKELLIASKLGHKQAQFDLALLYIKGKGTKTDIAQAYLWLNVAAEAKIKPWRSYKTQIRDLLSTKQLNSLNPYVNKYISEYGAKTQDVSCESNKRTGSHLKLIQCFKRSSSGKKSQRLEADIFN